MEFEVMQWVSVAFEFIDLLRIHYAAELCSVYFS
jgi:hypothetical protein